MTDVEMLVKVEERRRLANMVKEFQAQLDSIDSQIKNEMTGRALQEMLVGGYTLRYKEVISNRFDSKKFKTECGEQLYNKYCMPSVSMRFTIS